MVRLASILVLGACAVFSAASAMPEAGDALAEAAHLEARGTTTRSSTKKNGHTVVKTTTRSKGHHKGKKTKAHTTTSKPTSSKTSTTTSTTTSAVSGPCNGFPSTYTDPSGRTYNVECGQDLSNYYSSAFVSSFGACFAACDASSGCRGFTYDNDDPGLCQLSNNPVIVNNGPGFDSAILVS